ncbi:MAG: hypothetical protein NVSMB25_16900 [Thermoleophilaceae bacterium]
MTDPYGRLVELAERELDCVRKEDLEGFERIAAERSELIAGLPAGPPASARGSLERAAALQAKVGALLAQQMAAARVELGRLEQGREAIQGYAPAPGRLQLFDRVG